MIRTLICCVTIIISVYDIKGGIFNASNEDWMANPNLKNETINSWELGLELKAFENRVGVDVAYYKKNAKDQILKDRCSFRYRVQEKR